MEGINEMLAERLSELNLEEENRLERELNLEEEAADIPWWMMQKEEEEGERKVELEEAVEAEEEEAEAINLRQTTCPSRR